MKITAKEAGFILGQKKTHLGNYLIAWTLEPCRAGGFLLGGKFKTAAKIGLFLPVVIMGIFICAFDGGLRAFPHEISRTFDDFGCIREYPDKYPESRYSRMKKIFEKNA